MSVALLLSGCGTGNKAKGTVIVAGGGAALAGGAGAGNLIGRKMDRQREELAKIEGAQVEAIDAGQAIKVTFESGFLFQTNSSTLSPAAKTALTQFAASLTYNPDTDVHIIGHTDNTGKVETNDKLSAARASSVKDYLASQGINTIRLTAEGAGSSQPMADNSTRAGQAQNRRTEVYISANEKMYQEAEAGTLK
ncbi:membrane protein [Bacteroidia bacterium]|nr:membrane protein [Bacteroidia bacterium]